jgi:hexosaminidase
MKLRDLRWVLFIPLICGILSCSQKEVTLGDLEVIPLPNEVSLLNDGTSFVIDESTTICYPEGNEKMKRNAEFLAAYIKQVAATEVRLSTDAKGEDNAIVLSLDNTLSLLFYS